MMEDLLKEGTDYEDYTDNYMVEQKSCCGSRKADGEHAGCGCGKGGIPIQK